ncbi:hypothetical protein HN011_000717 [Eciton burchellii]|nr:hypothetical protein HN011_000717 [Eciton burchellii]
MYRAYSTIPVESLQIVTDTPPLDLQIAIKAMKIQQDNFNRNDEISQERKLEELLNDTWNNRWLETQKGQWTHEVYPDLRSRKEVDHDPTLEMVHFLTRHGPFAAKLAQMILKESDKCTCGSAQTTKHLWESCTKSELRRLHDTESKLTKILQDKDKHKEFQLLVKEMEKGLRDEEYQSKSRNAGNRSAR